MQKTRNGEPVINSYPYPLQIWKLGEQLIFALGGEPVVEYALNLKQLFGPEIFVLGYSNDVMGYIPTEVILKEGGYEGEISQRAYGLPGKWKSGIERQILQEIIRLSAKFDVSLMNDHLDQLEGN